MTRLRIPEKEYNKIPNKDPYVNKMLMNQIIPHKLQTATKRADDAMADLLNVAYKTKVYDFEDGIYYAMPNDPRGSQIEMMKAAALAKAKEIEAEFKNLAVAINTDSTKPTVRTPAQ